MSAPQAQNATADIVAAARKVVAHPGFHPNHLGACTGMLSQPSCTCGLADLRFAVARLERAESQVAAERDVAL